MKRSRKPQIPVEFLLQMGTCDVTIHGVKLTTHVANCAAAVDKHIANLRCHLECTTKVVGLDVKKLKPATGGYTTHALILCVFRRCLIIHLDYVGNHGNAPESLDIFLNDPKICFVGITKLPEIFYLVKFSNPDVGVQVGDLAARVLRNPALTESSLSDLALQVGVPYEGPPFPTTEIEVDSRNPKVLTDEHVMAAASDGYAYYQIGYKLLTSL
uniref:3'-5' exonuclease domain-containing protein n=1 Tax=Chenopodium quinoa TaxID=63459 RepID=A0A803KMX4_CHEQI